MQGSVLGLGRAFACQLAPLILGLSAGCVGCGSGVITDAGPPDAGTSSRVPDAGLDAGVGPRDAGLDAGVGPRDAGLDAETPPACEAGGTCTEPWICYENGADRYLQCTCSSGAFVCGEILPEPPTMCVEGGECTRGTCAVDDGREARHCRCEDARWACLIAPLTPCPTDGSVPCTFELEGEEIACFARSLDPRVSRSEGELCSHEGGGTSTTGIIFDVVCPAAPPEAGTECGDGTIFSEAINTDRNCRCSSRRGDCVCGCRNPFPEGPLLWLCLP